MKKTIFLFLLFTCILFTSQIFSQGFGGHPVSVKWKKIKTKNVRIIFPEGQEEKASRIVTIIDLMAENQAESIGPKKRRIDLVLQANQVVSNGYVGLLPFRSEFFATAFQNNHLLGNLDWLDQLAIHEYRHVQQMVNGRRGIFNLLYYLTGESIWAIAMNISVPGWFFEGDAVMLETALTNGGRGRSPYFQSVQRAILLDDINYKYKEIRNGSFQDLLPDHYTFGYNMINHARHKEGPNVWKDVLKHATRYRTVFYPFSGALKKHTGLRARHLYRETNAALKERWQRELKTITLTEQVPLVSKPKTVTNYRNAHYLDDGSIVYVKSSYDKTPALYRLNGETEQELTTIGIEPEGYMSVNNKKIAWTELRVDIRRSNENFSIIKSYDLTTGVKRSVTKKGKYFSPHFSSDGNQIISVEANADLQNHLLIINAISGVTVEKIQNPKNDFIVMPKWTGDDQAIVYLAKRNSQLAFFEYDINSKEITQLSDWVTHNIGHFNIRNNTIYFSAGFSGVDNIYELSLAGDRKITQITSVKIGAYMPDVSPDGLSLLMCEQTTKGKLLTEIDLDFGIDKEVEIEQPIAMERYNVAVGPTEGDMLKNLPSKTYEVKNYHGLLGTKVHGWSYQGRLYWGDGTPRNSYKVTGVMDNILNNFSATVSSEYRDTPKLFSNSFDVSYSYLFPILKVGLESKKTRFIEENIYKGGFSIPLSRISGNYFTYLNFGGDMEWYTGDYFQNFLMLTPNLNFSNKRQTAVQHITTRLGQELNLNYSKSINRLNTEYFGGDLSLYFPGFGENHSIVAHGAIRKELSVIPGQFSDSFVYARGYFNPEPFYTSQAKRLSLDYHMPLVYIDGGIGGVIQFKRLRADGFIDLTSLDTPFESKVSQDQNSIGIDLLIDSTLFNLLDISIGLRGAMRFNVEVSLENPAIILTPVINLGL